MSGRRAATAGKVAPAARRVPRARRASDRFPEAGDAAADGGQDGVADSGTLVLLDSCILIDHLNGVHASSEWLRTRADARVSPITVAEVLAGLDGEPRDLAARLLAMFTCLPLDREVAEAAAELRRRHGWRLPDAFQAALARRHGLWLATRDADDFPPDRHAFVSVPYVLGRSGAT
jgi:predicted nucleic acid-binding protein